MTKNLERLRSDLAEYVRDEVAAACELLGEHVDLDAPDQVQIALFDILGLTSIDHAIDTPSLESLQNEQPHPFLRHLLNYRAAMRLEDALAHS